MVITLCGNVAAVIFEWLSANVVAKIMLNLRKEMFEHLNQLALSYYGKEPEGGLLNHFSCAHHFL
jgi:hypothetical protein